MTSIAVIGANGQVGTEVCLLLSKLPGVSVVPIVRSKLGAALLERCGLSCRIGALSSDSAATTLLAGCDLVSDFSLPAGMPFEVRRAIRSNVSRAIRNAPRGAPYVFMSSTMAFGNGNSGRYQDLWFARTPYAASKRDGERWTRLLGHRYRRPTYVFRLGQVFGELQSVSRGLITSATSSKLALMDGQSGNSPSDAVFCSTIARALVNVAHASDPPGTYTILESPERTWRQLFAFHAQQAGIIPQFVETANGPSNARPGRLVTQLVQSAMELVAKQVRQHKDLLMAHLLPHYAGIELRVKARHSVQRARAEVAPPERRDIVEWACLRGPVPGKRLSSLSNGNQTMMDEVIAVRQLLETCLGPESHNYH
jgi:nucleoside-diphosphate-sugar epimerase